MVDEKPQPVMVFACGGDLCPSGDGKPCDDDGPGVEWETGGSTNCSRCGRTALDRCLMGDLT